MFSRLATLLTVIAFGVGTAGTIAIAGSTKAGQTSQTAGALDKPGKHCGDKNHIGFREDECKGGGPKN